jgi:hypothetical protein
MPKTVIKASGHEEAFDFQKLMRSLVRSGATEDVASDIARKVEIQISPSSHTRHIYRLAKKMLRQYSHASGMKYSIKKALAYLGPSGFPFEKYFAKILAAYGYTVELNSIIDGYCIHHEVDIVASKDQEQFVIECKYHSEGGKATDVKVALYVHSRVEDIKKASELRKGDMNIKRGWLVTNTRCTSDAIRYAECVGLKIVSWGYPEADSLEKMIEGRRLYPVTILASVKKQSLDALFSRDIVFAQDIADMDEETFIRKSGLDDRTARALKGEADKLCPCV